MLASLPPSITRGGLGEWLAGSSLVLRPCRCTGGDGGQGTALTYDNLSYVPSSMIPELCVPNDNSNFPDWTVHSSPRFSLSHLDGLVAVLPLEAGDDGIVGRKFSPTASCLP
jgi:hypothetical protein